MITHILKNKIMPNVVTQEEVLRHPEDKQKKLLHSGHRLKSCSGQALAELAIFAAIFLYVLSVFIQYGLSANFEQEQEMLTFRRALANAASVFQTSRVGTVVRLNDRPFPDARDAFGIDERNSLSAQGTVTWSNALYGSYKDMNDIDLPRVIYAVNDNERTYTTAAFKVKPKDTWCMYKHDGGSGCSQSTIRLKSYDKNGHWYYESPIVMYGWTESHGWGGSDWKPRESSDENDAADENDASDGYIYQRVLDLEGKYADVDGDDKDELIVKQFETEENDWDGNTKKRLYVSRIGYLDFQDGEIDTTINDKDIQAGRSVQGISPNYLKTLVVNDDTALTRQENMPDATDSIVTTTNAAAEENITHYIYTNNGEKTQTDSFGSDDSVTWETAND